MSGDDRPIEVHEADKAREARLRRAGARVGYGIHKSRARNWSLHNQQGYMVYDIGMNAVLIGSDFDCDLDDVEEFLKPDGS